MAQKLKVGDKVVYLRGSCYTTGDKLEVIDFDNSDTMPIKVTNGRIECWVEKSEIALIKEQKNCRISALEQQVMELKSEVAKLKSYPKPSDIAEIFAKALLEARIKEEKRSPKRVKLKSTNEKRKAIIAEAKAFVMMYETDKDGLFVREGSRKLARLGHYYTKFYVNTEKLAVTALVYGEYYGKLTFKGIAKCAPDDVFNADIGKAIALGKALGLDVSKFEQAVNPTEVIIGQVVENHYEGVHKVFSVRPTNRTYGRGAGDEYCDAYNEGYTYIGKQNFEMWSRLPKIKRILDDSEAQY